MKSNCNNIADSSPNEKTFSSLSAKSVRCGAGRRVGAETEISVFLRHKTVDRRESILYNHSCSVNGAVAQLARAFGSYPKCHRFESSQRYHGAQRKLRPASLGPVGQVVKTPPFHGGNMGSSPVRVTTPLN